MSNAKLITDWNDAPLVLNAADVGQILCLSKPVVYTLFKRQDFPAIRLSEKRIVVSRDALRSWLERQGA